MLLPYVVGSVTVCHVTIKVSVAASPGFVDIAPPGHGHMAVPSTRLRVPGVVTINAEPVGEGALYTPVALEAVVWLIDPTAKTVPFGEGVPTWIVHIGDWRYEVVALRLSGNVDSGWINPRHLAAIRLPGLLRRALRPLVVLVSDDGGFTLGGQDPDERAVLAYITAQLVNDNPTQAVADELGVNANAAGQRVFRLRKAGRLPASKKGRPLCPDGPSQSGNSPQAVGKHAPMGSARPPSSPTKKQGLGASTS